MEHLSIGPTPCEESCEQLGPNYDPQKARAECKRFIDLIRKTVGDEPSGARLHIHSNPHDFGTYLEVCVQFNEEDEEACDYASKVDNEAPAKWEDKEG